jgi:hypothetical protein
VARREIVEAAEGVLQILERQSDPPALGARLARNVPAKNSVA